MGPESVSSVYNVEPSYILYSTFTAQTTSRRVVQKQIPHVWQGTECYLSEYLLDMLCSCFHQLWGTCMCIHVKIALPYMGMIKQTLDQQSNLYDCVCETCEITW